MKAFGYHTPYRGLTYLILCSIVANIFVLLSARDIFEGMTSANFLLLDGVILTLIYELSSIDLLIKISDGQNDNESPML